ncbi:MAG TPA: HlyD family efflux transporter periplasmic adaptor subunit [Pseudomonadales bacterium]|nr:HlyD family efflux transporter periplasmic adaptor subunit [Pseudomonadales bacterium]
MRITAPVTPEATTGVVLAALRVGPGDIVEAGQVLAITESSGVLEALLAEARATVVSADLEARAEEGRADAACVLAQTSRREADRRASLLERQLSSQEEWERADADARFQEASCRAARIGTEAARGRVRLAEAMVVTREAALERSRVRAPFAGRVLEVMTWPGELVGRDGILELAAVDRMYAIAEIYETDVAQVRAGQRATVRSKALAQPLGGVVEHVRLQVRKQDEFGTDPAARQDARIVEVEIRLDDPAPAAGLTNLQVEVVIES